MHSRLLLSLAFVSLALAPMYAGEYSGRELSSRVLSAESGADMFEVSAGYNYIHLGDAGIEQAHLHGGDVSAFYNMTSWLGIGGDFMANFGDHERSFSGTRVNLESRRFVYLGGIRITPWRTERLRFFTELLAGGVHAELEGSVGPVSQTFEEDGFACAAGGGIDWRFSPSFAWRILQADYLPTHLGDQWQHDVRVSTGLVFSFGGR